MKTITIGIPALNEEQNIGFLLRDLVSQKITNFRLSRIIVVSDGSIDETVSKVRSFRDKRIQVIDGKVRLGKSARQNEIISKVKSDVLVLLDADILITDKLFLEKLVTPIIEGKADMTSSGISELPARTFFEKILDVSMKLKLNLFSEFKGGNNVYNCHGPARAFGKAVYTGMLFEQSDGEDMFSYLYCISKAKRFLYIRTAKVEYQLPSTPIDHYKQSKRYLDALEFNRAIFGDELTKREMNISMQDYLKSLCSSFPYILANAIFVIGYVFVFGSVIAAKTLRLKPRESWRVTSSKSLHI